MKIKILLSAFLFFSLQSVTFSAEVGIDLARSIAKKAYLEKSGFNQGSAVQQNVVIQDTYVKKAGDTDYYFVFTFEKSGFVIVSADDVLPPVLGYSIENSYIEQDQPDSYRNFMQSYCDAVNYIRNNNITQTEETHQLWDQFLTDENETPAKNTETRAVEPLLSSTWDQGSLYNLYCPVDAAGPGGHVYAGCVATAMAQVMYYWRYPLQGIGSHSYYYPPYGNLSANFGATTYDWEKMQNAIDNASPDAIALLQYHCGVAVDMMYAPDGSGAYSYDVPYAIEHYFGYSSESYYTWKDDHSNSAWINLLKANIDDSWPIYYSGHSTAGGHAFVCDGYQDDSFHFNFGWSGSSNGYYTLLSVNGFNQDQGAVLDIHPGTNYPYYCTGDHLLTNISGSFEDGSSPDDVYENNINCSWLISPQTAEDSISKIELDFVNFETDINDYVTIYDGSTAAASILAQFSGNEIPANIFSTGNEMLVVFTTNGSVEAKGWLVEYTAFTPEFCQGMITLNDSEGTLTDGSGTFNYHNNSVCMWQITPPGGEAVTLSFTAFDTENNSDKLRVYDLESQELLAEYSGTYSAANLPEPVTAVSGQMFVTFSTNSSTTKQGWSAAYTNDLTGIADNNNNSGRFRIYPNPAKEKITLEFVTEQKNPVGFRLMNLLGQTIMSQTITNVSESKMKEIGLVGVRPGIYLIQLTDQTTALTQRIVIE